VWLGHLAAKNEGLIATTACLAGPLAHKEVIENGKITQKGGRYDPITKTFTDPDEVNTTLTNTIHQYFGDRLYIEIQDHPMWEQEAYNQFAIKFAREHNIPLVITCDTHYPTEEDKEIHTFLMAQQFKKTLTQYKEEGIYNCKNWIREPEEMYRAAEKMGVVDAFWNTSKIAEQCNLSIELGKVKPPSFDVSKCADYQEFIQETCPNG
jgi:DNA polymerase III alpha subunit